MPRIPLLALTVLFLAAPAFAAPVSAVAYRADGQLLAVGGYGDVRLVDPAKAECTATLAGQTRQVSTLGFAPDGQRLAVASGEPGKLGELRIYTRAPDGIYALKHTVAAHKDLVYAMSFASDGKTLATTGYDRLIQLWDAATGKLVRTLADHSDAVYGLAFQPNGKLLASASADRAVKMWDSTTGVRLYTLSEPTDWVYALAWHPDGKKLAAGGIDKSARVWEITAEGGKLISSVFAHDAAVTKLAYSSDGQTLFSVGEDRVVKAWDAAKMVERRVFPAQADAVLGFAARADGKQVALGRFDGVALVLDVATGQATPIKDAAPKPKPERFGIVTEREPSDSPRTAMDVVLPTTVKGTVGRFGDVDFVRFDAKAGDSVGIEVITAAIASKLDAVVELTDDEGRVLEEATDGVLGYTFAKAGRYSVGVRDREYRGGADMPYVLNIGPIPIVTSVFPLSLRVGTEGDVRLGGVFLEQRTAKVKVPVDAKPGTKIAVPLAGKPLGKAEIVVGEHPERVGAGELAVPGSGHGVVAKAGGSEVWTFPAKKGQRLVIETHARRFGSPLDSVIEVCDAKGEVLTRHTLRCVARVFTTFRDNDSATTGIRLESWNDLAMGDLVLVGNELMKIDQLPKNPDDDCRFYAVNGKRTGYLGTTPSHHALGTSMYKVEPHPPGSTFPSNGMPVFQLPYRNDDGQGEINPDAGKDSHLFFDPPADGTYQIRVMDARGRGREDFAYRVTVRTPRPDFSLSFDPREPKVWKGNGVPLTVKAVRLDGFDGGIDVRGEDVPAGFECPATVIEAGQREATFPLWASATAASGTKPLRLIGKAVIDGKEVVRESVGGVPQAVEAGDLVTTTNVSELMIRPGQESRMVVTIERRNGFAGRVPVEVKGLPYGVRVQNIGLNGILVTPGQTSREVVIYAEPWVEPMAVPFVVLSRREGKNTDHVAKPVTLRVTR